MIRAVFLFILMLPNLWVLSQPFQHADIRRLPLEGRTREELMLISGIGETKAEEIFTKKSLQALALSGIGTVLEARLLKYLQP